MDTSADSSERAVVPVVGNVLLIGIVVVLATTVSLLVFGLGEAVGETPPTAALEAEQEDDVITFTHLAGEPIDPANLHVEGAENWETSDQISAGETIVVEPEPGAQEVALTWDDRQRSAILMKVDVNITSQDRISLPVNADPGVESEEQFGILSATEFGTNAVEVCVEKEGVDGETEIGVQVTDHHGTFDEGSTTWNPTSSSLAERDITFDDGTGCFEIGNPDVDDDAVLLTLFPFGSGLETVDDIENIAVAVEGEEPEAMSIEGVTVP